MYAVSIFALKGNCRAYILVLLLFVNSIAQEILGIFVFLVVREVGFKNKRLEISRNVHPQVAALIEICWRVVSTAFILVYHGSFTASDNHFFTVIR
ncbi:hypothetical protein CsatB_009336 [Cannabis sativa]